MEPLMGVAGFLGFIAFLVLFIINAVKKKPKKKSGIGMAVCAVLFIGAFAATGDSNPQAPVKPEPSELPAKTESPALVQSQSSQEPESAFHSEASEAETAGKPAGSYTLPCGMEVFFQDSVRNDVTERWRLSKTSSSLVPSEYAVEYYNEMFSSDDEIHGIWNATLNTTTAISKSGNLLFVDTHEYIDGEEHDAKILFSGVLLSSEIIDLDTGLPWEASE